MKESLIDHISVFVFDLFKEKLSTNYLYHNYIHTQQTVEAAEKIAKGYDINSTEKEDLLIAAWMHDTGYTKGYKNHEEESVKIAEGFLGKDFPKARLELIKALILSTKVDEKHANILEEILHDADYINIGKSNFFERAELLRFEWELVYEKTYTDLEWAQVQLDFIISKNFKTTYAQAKYGDKREKNIQQQKEVVEKLKSDQFKLQTKEDSTKLKANKEGRGIETLYRSVYDNHMNLSALADNKANIMISVNTIIISLVITLFGSSYTFTGEGITHVRFVFPMLFLVISSLVAVVFAILSARPNITSKEKYELSNKTSSALFFGNFAQLSLNEFVSHVKGLKDEKESLYSSMSTDIYHLGVVLVKKYKLLTWSYNIFMTGLILCGVSFLVIVIFSS
ncbi:Pycsar system effector family protein [Pedobacter cryophilus]|uniref:HD domain-containing protein n=1 Tax=Pedobacter cryophilus TaxID=2571271 RepID=A0A4U1C5Y2_9SPHI|nr:Pycsar system effector family protein [Pedobacter cryophilus]TKB98750.1 HD domain-containing protein [Pedobacter cryophilus]